MSQEFNQLNFTVRALDFEKPFNSIPVPTFSITKNHALVNISSKIVNGITDYHSEISPPISPDEIKDLLTKLDIFVKIAGGVIEKYTIA